LLAQLVCPLHFAVVFDHTFLRSMGGANSLPYSVGDEPQGDEDLFDKLYGADEGDDKEVETGEKPSAAGEPATGAEGNEGEDGDEEGDEDEDSEEESEDDVAIVLDSAGSTT
jgi:hypothetical protein